MQTNHKIISTPALELWTFLMEMYIRTQISNSSCLKIDKCEEITNKGKKITQGDGE